MIKKNKPEYKKVHPPFGYFGSKTKLAIELCQNLPPHNCWVDAFCGSSAVTLAKPPVPIEVINDIDGEIVNVFRQLRNNSEVLRKQIEMTPYAEEELVEARSQVDGLTDLEKARRFLVKSMLAINGSFGEAKGGFSYSDSYSRNGIEARVNRWNNLPDRLEKVVSRLKNVRIENKDAKKLIERFADRPATLIYLDPPYLGKRTNGYENEANDHDFHLDLLNSISNSNAMIFLSGYHNELYDDLLTEQRGWSRKEIETTTQGSNGSKKQRTEVLWMNANFTETLNSGRLPIELDEKEIKNKKLNPKR
ncbi:DNA adenine methylase [Muricauda sp. HICW]|uniref:DNA adenine methylase n=1 Tax=Flagellimonas chongwuensis TaxID=2697365 RepID=A0A850NIA3_9FLAO|nr:DNA adenine methylase [Allomuricauda chongwuensis]NVN18262.1 DNA adenine methylase [Allomuricauda chongwuensis]